MKSLRSYWPALALVGILAFVAVVRIRLLSAPMERDEGEYAYAGRLMLEGVPPYRLFYNMKMPGTYAAYAVSMALFGQSVAGMRAGFLLTNLATIILIFFLGRRFFNAVGALAAGASYALLSLSPSVDGPYMHATHFVVLMALAGMLALLRARESGGRALFFASGVLFGVAFLMKQPGGAFCFFGAALILWWARRRPPDLKTHALREVLFCLGVATPIVLTLIALWRAGVWEKFWWWTVTYAKVHATALTWRDGIEMLAAHLVQFQWDWAFWIMAGAGLLCWAWQKDSADEKFFVVALLVFSVAAVCPTLTFTRHYFVLMLPVISLLCGKAVMTCADWTASHARGVLRFAPVMLFCVIWLDVMWSHREIFFQLTPAEVTAAIYPANEFEVYPAVGAYLKEHTPTNATIAVLGSEPELLFYAHRRSVTGYIYMYDLVQEQPFREKMEREMRGEVESGRPDYIIVVNLRLSWLNDTVKNGASLHNWMTRYTQTEYQPYGAVSFSPSRTVWGSNSFSQIPPDDQMLSIYTRKQ